jgi:hypothetical protein
MTTFARNLGALRSITTVGPAISNITQTHAAIRAVRIYRSAVAAAMFFLCADVEALSIKDTPPSPFAPWSQGIFRARGPRCEGVAGQTILLAVPSVFASEADTVTTELFTSSVIM